MRWTKEIEDEWTRNLMFDGQPREKVEQTRDKMRLAPEEALEGDDPFETKDYQLLIPEIKALKSLYDKDDAHVIAAAIACKAKFIVTDNLKDFCPVLTDPEFEKKFKFKIEAIPPDIFFLSLLKKAPTEFISCMEKVIADIQRKKTSYSMNEFIWDLETNTYHQTAKNLRWHSISSMFAIKNGLTPYSFELGIL
jgi:predicted nucleic acid-binding protein